MAHGVPIYEVSRWLGHRSVKTTIDIYGHLLPSAWRRCRTVLQDAMRPAPLIEAGPTEAPTESGVSTQATGQGAAGEATELQGAGIELPCWDGVGMGTPETTFPQVGALHQTFRFDV